MRAQACVDVWYSTLGLCEAIPYTNHTAVTVQNSAIHNRRTVLPLSSFTLHNDLHIPFVAKETSRLSHLYHHRLASHHNALVTELATLPPIARRLK